MNVPRPIRRWVYKRIIKEIDRHGHYRFFDTYLCGFCRFRFPYIGIKHYPELWTRRTTLKRYDQTRTWGTQVWFPGDAERRVYVQHALDLLNHKTQ